MLTENEYLIAWGVYLLAVIGLGSVWWRLTRVLSVIWLQTILRFIYFPLLVTPAVVVDGSVRLAPATMIWLLESTIVEANDLARVYPPLIITVAASLMLAFVYTIFAAKRASD